MLLGDQEGELRFQIDFFAATGIVKKRREVKTSGTLIKGVPKSSMKILITMQTPAFSLHSPSAVKYSDEGIV